MDGKRRQYVPPSIRGVPASRAAAAAAAEAAATRLVNLRRLAVEQQQIQPHSFSSGDTRLSASPQARVTLPYQNSLSNDAETSHAPLVSPENFQLFLADAPSSTLPESFPASTSVSFTHTQQQQQQFSPNSAFYLQGGFPDAQAASPLPASSSSPSSCTFPQMPLDPAAAALSTSNFSATRTNSINSPPPGSFKHIRIGRESEDERVFTLPRPESFRIAGPCYATLPTSSSFTTSTAAAASVAAKKYVLTHGGCLPTAADVSRYRTCFPVPDLPPPTVHQSSSSPLTASQAAAAVVLKGPPANSSGPSSVSLSTAIGAEVQTTAQQQEQQHNMLSLWRPNKEEQQSDDTVNEDNKPKGRNWITQRASQAPRTESGVFEQDKKDDDDEARVPDCSDGSSSSSSLMPASSSASEFTAASKPATRTAGSADSNKKNNMAVAFVANGTVTSTSIMISPDADHPAESKLSERKSNALVCERQPADRLCVVETGKALRILLQCVRKGAADISPTTAAEDEEKNLEKNTAVEEALAAEHDNRASQPYDVLAREESTMITELRNALQKRDSASVQKRIAKAAALPPPPAALALDLLRQLPAAPRRAVYSRDDCPCMPQDGFDEKFHECVQQFMTRAVLQRDGRACDPLSASVEEKKASHTPSSEVTTDSTTTYTEQQRYQHRVAELQRGVPSDVRDVVAFARFVVQQLQDQQAVQLHPAHLKIHDCTSASSVSSSKPPVGPCEEGAVADVTNPLLTSLKAFVEAKLYMMLSLDGRNTSNKSNSDNSSGFVVTESEQRAAKANDSPIPDEDLKVSVASSPVVGAGSSSGPVATSFATAHQRFAAIARSASAARQEKARAAQQAEQRLAAAAAAWRENFQVILLHSESYLSSCRQRLQQQDYQNSVTSSSSLNAREAAGQGLLQQLQNFFMPGEVDSQMPWDSEKMTRKQRKRARVLMEEFCNNVKRSGHALPKHLF